MARLVVAAAAGIAAGYLSGGNFQIGLSTFSLVPGYGPPLVKSPDATKSEEEEDDDS